FSLQPFTELSLKLQGRIVVAGKCEVFGGPLTQVSLLATKQTRDKNPTRFKAVGNALETSTKMCNADKDAAAVLWKKAQNASEGIDELRALLDDPGFEFTSQPNRIAYFAAFLNRIGTMKSKLGDSKDLFWETAYDQQGD